MNDDLATLKMRFEPKEGLVLKLDRQLNAVRFTSCGRFLLAAGHDGLIHRFDAANVELPELKPLAGHNGWVQRLAIPAARADTPASDVVFSADSWGQLRCSSFIDETAVPRWAHPSAHDGWILDLALSPSGKLIASCGIDRVVRIWSAADGTKLHEFTNPDW
jgi:WD40 repeat protein